jgi:hypothetical protein
MLGEPTPALAAGLVGGTIAWRAPVSLAQGERLPLRFVRDGRTGTKAECFLRALAPGTDRFTFQTFGPLNMTEAQAAVACLGWNEHNTPPLPDEKVQTTIASIARAEAKKRGTNGQPIVAAPNGAAAEIEDHAAFGVGGARSEAAKS